jgi:hypothetical protein
MVVETDGEYSQAAKAFCAYVGYLAGTTPAGCFIPSLIPMPREGSKTITIGGEEFGSAFATKDDGDNYIDGYQWCLNNWGTKWGDCHLEQDETDSNVFRFDTAWGLADTGLAEVSRRFPNVPIHVLSIEEQPAFRCHMLYENGEGTVLFDEDLHKPDMIDAQPDYDTVSAEPGGDDKYWEFHSSFHSGLAAVDLFTRHEPDFASTYFEALNDAYRVSGLEYSPALESRVEQGVT